MWLLCEERKLFRRFFSQQIEQRISKQPQKRIKSPTSWKLWQTIVNSFLSSSYNSSSSGKFTTTWNYSFWRRRREVDEEILRSRLRTYFHVTSSRRPPCRRRGCLISVITIQADLLYSQGVYENKLPPAKLTEIGNVNVRQFLTHLNRAIVCTSFLPFKISWFHLSGFVV